MAWSSSPARWASVTERALLGDDTASSITGQQALEPRVPVKRLECGLLGNLGHRGRRQPVIDGVAEEGDCLVRPGAEGQVAREAVLHERHRRVLSPEHAGCDRKDLPVKLLGLRKL